MLLCHLLLTHQKTFFHRSKDDSLLFQQLEEIITCDLFGVYYLHTIKQKASLKNLLLENLDQLTNLNVGFVPVL